MPQRDELELRGHRATVPTDTADPAQFGQPIETTKDAFVLGLREFFDGTAQTASRVGELPTIEKYATGGSGYDSYETVVRILQDNPDVIEELPQIAIASVTARNKRLTIGRPIVATVQHPPRVDSPLGETFALADGDVLAYRTMPDGVTWTESTVTFLATRFSDNNPITAARAEDVARVFNEQALYARAQTTSLPGGRTGVRFQAGGPAGGGFPNAFEIRSDTSQNVLDVFGIDAGEADDTDNPMRPPMHRYHQATELQVNVDVIATNPNQRRELVDLVYSWATFWLEKQHFELMGRGTFDDAYPDECYQVIMHQEVSVGGAQAVNRPADTKDKIHTQRITIPVTTIQYLDRSVLAPDAGSSSIFATLFQPFIAKTYQTSGGSPVQIGELPLSGSAVSWLMTLKVSAVTNENKALWSSQTTGQEQFEIRLGAYTAPNYDIEVQLGTSETVTFIEAFEAGIWNQLVVTYDGLKVSAYVNGVRISSESVITTELPTPTAYLDMRLLATSQDTAVLAGSIVSHIALWKTTTLSWTDIVRIYNAGALSNLDLLGSSRTISAKPDHWWRMGDGSANPFVLDEGIVGGFNGFIDTSLERDEIWLVDDTPGTGATRGYNGARICPDLAYGSLRSNEPTDGYASVAGPVTQLQSALGGSDTMTISAWVKMNSTGYGTISAWGVPGIDAGFELVLSPNAALKFGLLGFGTSAGSQTDAAVISNDDDPWTSAWVHIVGRYDGTQAAAVDRVVFTVDNVTAASSILGVGAPAAISTTAGSFAIGGGGPEYSLGATITHNGHICQLAIWDSYLTDLQVSQLYGSGTPPDTLVGGSGTVPEPTVYVPLVRDLRDPVTGLQLTADVPVIPDVYPAGAAYCPTAERYRKPWIITGDDMLQDDTLPTPN